MNFLALFLSLPTKEATARMRVWRGLRTLGCGTLRDGVYLLPESPEHEQSLAAVAADVVSMQGSAEIYRLQGRDEVQDAALQALFERGADYAEFAADARALRQELATAEAAGLQRRLQALNRRLEALIGIDFFPAETQAQAVALLDDLRLEVTRRLSPDEPSAADLTLPRLDTAAYRRRVWATRRRPWVDRLASAWLIKRHIDPKARIVWLATPADCHADWLGFDFDGATFSHVGAKVTFETLLASFGLDQQPALLRLGELVHCLDVGSLPVAEAAGVESLLAGIRADEPDDDRLLAKAMKVFDWLLAGYREKTPPTEEST